MVKLETLLLDSNQLERLPPSCSTLTSMTLLDLSDNQLTTLCKVSPWDWRRPLTQSLQGVSRWSSLTKLSLRRNQISRMSRGLGGA